MRKDVQWVQYDPATKKATKKGPVTAKDIVYGVKRTVDPATASSYAYVDYIIKNAEAINTGENKDLESLGVRAVDDYTVEFTLTQPAGYFPGIAGMWVNRPQPQAAIEAGGDKWTEPGSIWTNGPYVLDTWEHESKMVLVKNPYYYDAKNVAIEQINCRHGRRGIHGLSPCTRTASWMLRPCPRPTWTASRPMRRSPRSCTSAPNLCTYYYGFNTTKPPFDNVKVRQAFSYAIDRQKLIDTVLKGRAEARQELCLPRHLWQRGGRSRISRASSSIAAKAKALLAEAGYPDGKGLPEITMMFNTSEGHQKIAQFVQQSCKDNLGVEVKLANQEWAVYLKTVNGDDTPQIYRMGWCADYPDENNWVLENFHPTKSLNNPKWTGAGCGQASTSWSSRPRQPPIPRQRKKLYFEAEKILVVDEAVIAPIYYYTRVVCTKPYVQRTYAPMGGEHWHTWKVLAH